MQLPLCVSGKVSAGAGRLLLDELRVVRSAWQAARAKKPQHSTRYNETIQ
jgi:hypothetical protein